MTEIWSGGIAFSYFPAESGQGEFGMVTISGNTVTTSTDFTRLAAQYSKSTPPNSPTQTSSSSSTYPSCPSQNSTFLASSTLPPTPNDAACNCLESGLSCDFSPPAGTNTTAINVINGQLLGTACGLLSTSGGNCNDISSNGTTGSYGRVSFCAASGYSSPIETAQKLNHLAFSDRREAVVCHELVLREPKPQIYRL